MVNWDKGRVQDWKVRGPEIKSHLGQYFYCFSGDSVESTESKSPFRENSNSKPDLIQIIYWLLQFF